MKRFVIPGLASLMCGVFLTCRARADQTWQGAAGRTNDWHTAANWSGGAVPTSGDKVYISNGGCAAITNADADASYVNLSGSGSALILSNRTLTVVNDVQPGSLANSMDNRIELFGTHAELKARCLKMGNGSDSFSEYIQHDGTSTLTGASTSVGKGSGSVGRLVIENGTFDCSGRWLLIADSSAVSTGTVVFYSGVVNEAYLRVGYRGTGSYTQYGGTNNISFGAVVGSAGGSTGTMTVAGGLWNDSKALTIGSSAGSEGAVVLSGGKMNCNKMIVGNSGTGSYIQYGGTNSMSRFGYGTFIGNLSGSTGTMTIAGGKYDSWNKPLTIANDSNTVGRMTLSGGELVLTGLTVGKNPTDTDASLIIRGPDASINISGALDCNNGGDTKLEFVLDGDGAGISKINCQNAYLDSPGCTVAWKIGPHFAGVAGTTYDLIQASGSIYTNGCVFHDEATGDMFEIALVNGNKTLRLTLTQNYPIHGTLIVVK